MIRAGDRKYLIILISDYFSTDERTMIVCLKSVEEVEVNQMLWLKYPSE